MLNIISVLEFERFDGRRDDSLASTTEDRASSIWGSKRKNVGDDDPVIRGESTSPLERLRKIEGYPYPSDTKVAFSSLKRVTEAEPTFASAWNRATRPPPSNDQWRDCQHREREREREESRTMGEQGTILEEGR
ncbi:unnamed protein product [Xylocopa violacea]|uniref:Uncharacterized protein n=1 Tax=Xylocopa violacea TaxID=135666 RepID=A0ABP1NJC1_XYLVO